MRQKQRVRQESIVNWRDRNNLENKQEKGGISRSTNLPRREDGNEKKQGNCGRVLAYQLPQPINFARRDRRWLRSISGMQTTLWHRG